MPQSLPPAPWTWTGLKPQKALIPDTSWDGSMAPSSCLCTEMAHLQRPLGRLCTFHQKLVGNLAASMGSRECPPHGLSGSAKNKLPPSQPLFCGNLYQKTLHFYVLSFIPHLVSTLGLWGEPTALGDLGLGDLPVDCLCSSSCARKCHCVPSLPAALSPPSLAQEAVTSGNTSASPG